MNLLVSNDKTTPFASAIQATQVQLTNCKQQLKSAREAIDLLMDQAVRQQKIDALKIEIQSIRTNSELSERKQKRLLSERQFELRYLRRLSEPSVAHQLYRDEYELEARIAHLTAELDYIDQMNRQLKALNH